MDHLDGGADNDLIYTTEAGDVAVGGPGNDHIQTTGGADIDGGDGDDTLSFYGAPAALRCGNGSDTVASQRLRGLRVDGCEQVVTGAFGLLTIAAAPIRWSARELRLPVRCREQGTSIIGGCRGGVAITLRRAGKRPLRLGRATFRLPAGRQVRARLILSAAGRRALRGLSHPLLELELSARSVVDPNFPKPPLFVPTSDLPDLTGTWRIRF